MPSARFALFTLNVLFALDVAASAQDIAETRSPDVLRVIELGGAARQDSLRLVLTHPRNHWFIFYRSVFYYEARLRPALRGLVQDSTVGILAADLLTLVGESDDLEFMIQHPPKAKRSFDSTRWAYGVACSLLDASTEVEWSFLRNSAIGTYEDGWVDAGAIQTLKLIASTRSRELLEEAQRRNRPKAREISRALEYIRSEPRRLEGPNLEELAARVAQTISSEASRSYEKPRYNELGDKALVAFTHSQGRDLYFYTATFCKVQNNWRPRSVMLSGQAVALADPHY